MLDTTKIKGYVKNNAEVSIKKVLFQFGSAKHIRIRPGIKTNETFGRISTDVIFQAPGCGWNSQGVTKLDNVSLSVEKFSLKNEVCDNNFEDTYYALLGKAGQIADGEEFNLEKDFVESKVEGSVDALERLVWRGDVLSSDPKFNRFDGLIKKLKASIPDARTGTVDSVADVTDQPYVEITIDTVENLEDGIEVTISGTTNYNGTFNIHNFQAGTATSTFYIIAPFVATETGTWLEANDQLIARTASVKDDIESLMDSAPDEFWELTGKKIFLSPALYRSVRKELIDLGGTGNFHVDLTKPSDTFMWPGEDIEVVRTKGMSGVNDIILSYQDNLWFGTDLVNDYETAKFFYDEGQDVHKLLMKMKGGTGCPHTNMVAIAA